jgi:L,D-transpeptidase catalytic domain
MKMGFGLIAAAMLAVFAVTPAFARDRHRPRLDSQEMRITNSPTDEPVVAPPVTVPESSVYDTPRPQVATALPPIPVAGQIETSTVAESIDGATVDGATAGTPASQDGVQTASVAVPLTSGEKKEVAGPPEPSRTPGSILFDQTRDDSSLDSNSWAVSIFKKRHELTVYYKGRLFKKYEAVFGRNLDLGAKLWAQDRRTPEGVYTIVEKYPSARFKWFLRLNYPNLVDRVRYETLRVNGVVPVDHDGKAPLVGSAIGIHGTDVPILNAGHINWTTGCISVNNKDIDELERLLPVGTVVIIKP